MVMLKRLYNYYLDRLQEGWDLFERMVEGVIRWNGVVVIW